MHIDNMVPGMVVSRSVCDRSGRMLLPAGSTLTERHFSLLRMWGVLEVEIAGDTGGESSAPADQALAPELVAAAREEVERLFRHNDREHPAITELMRICILRRGSRES